MPAKMKTGAGVKFFHVFVLAYYTFVLYTMRENNTKKLPEEIEMITNMRRFTLRYLTNWTFGLQTMYFAACILTYILNWIPGCQRLRDKVEKHSNFVVTSIATPMALMVTLVFWSIYLVDRELIFPKVIDLVMPAWINHSIHSLNSIFALADVYLINHKFPSILNASKGLLCYMLLYAGCIFGTYWQTGIWLYPFMSQMTWTMRAVFAISTFVGGLLTFLLVMFMSRLIWGSAAPVKSSKKSQKQKKK